jgi:hypothetical protein
VEALQGNDPNTASLVLDIRHGVTSALLPGDATPQTWESVIHYYDERDTRRSPNTQDPIGYIMLLASHHGSEADNRLPNGTTVAQRLQPHIVVFSSGNPRQHGHPNNEVASSYDQVIGFRAPIHAFDSSESRSESYTYDYDSNIYSTNSNGWIQARLGRFAMLLLWYAMNGLNAGGSG